MIRTTLAVLKAQAGILLIVIAACAGAAPKISPRAESTAGDIQFSASASCFSAAGSNTLVEIDYDIPYDQLNFTRLDTLYRATVDLSVVFLDPSGEQVGGDVWRRSVETGTYENTKASTLHFASRVEYRIAPGSYRMRVRVEDLASSRSGIAEMGIEVRAFGSSGLELSDPVFLDFFSDTLSYPNPSGTYVRGGARAAVMFSAYRPAGSDSIEIETSLVDSRGNVFSKGPVVVGRAATETKTIVFSIDTLPQDTFSFVVKLGDSIMASWPFVVAEPFFSDPLKYRERVESMRYIASEAELKKLREAAPPDRERVYRAFWDERDPDPSTEKNEAEIEYMSRVEYADLNFGGLVEGWKTDRGRILIQYGRPDEVDKHPFEVDMVPYEIWYYYTTGYRFVFVDKHNLGSYELWWWQGR